MAFESACRTELAKIRALSASLQNAIADFEGEEATLGSALIDIAIDLAAANTALEEQLAPRTRLAHSDLQALIEQRAAVAQAEEVVATINNLEQRLRSMPPVRPKAAERPTFDERVTTSAATEFCEVVAEVLRAWRYPDLRTVSFDTAKTDLVINGQDRANKGKGYRALTYAAFVIALMRYCRANGIPHSGLVVLDSPLNPFKGAETSGGGDLVSDEVKVAFYENLADDDSGDQVVIIENEPEPAEGVRDRVGYYRFTRNAAAGRHGFFPTPLATDHRDQ